MFAVRAALGVFVNLSPTIRASDRRLVVVFVGVVIVEVIFGVFHG
jgi:hypothetical protein